MLETDCDLLALVWRLLRRDRHSVIRDVNTCDFGVFEDTCFIADMQAVFVRAVWLSNRRLDRDSFLMTERDHFRTARKLCPILFNSPRGDDFNPGLQGFGGKLESTLVVSFAGRSVRVGVGPDFSRHLQADFRDQRSSDRSTE